MDIFLGILLLLAPVAALGGLLWLFAWFTKRETDDDV